MATDILNEITIAPKCRKICTDWSIGQHSQDLIAQEEIQPSMIQGYNEGDQGETWQRIATSCVTPATCSCNLSLTPNSPWTPSIHSPDTPAWSLEGPRNFAVSPDVSMLQKNVS